MKILDYTKQLFSKERRIYYDKVFWIAMIVLVILSMITMYSAGSQLAHKAIAHGVSHLSPFYSHVAFLLMGLVVAYFVQMLPSWLIRGAAYALLVFSIICLFLTFVPGLGVTINGARRWLRLGIVFQPSELAKISLIIVASDLLARMQGKEPKQRRKLLLWVLSLTVVICGVIMLSNLSTALLLGAIVFILMYLARVDWRVLGGIIMVAVMLLIGGYLIVENVYIKPGRELTGPFSRATTWVSRIDRKVASKKEEKTDTKLVINDSNRQEMCAKIAIARGSKTPLGVGPGNSKERDYLPLAFEDYIFAIYTEELGIVGAIVLIFFYLMILFRACTTSNRFDDHAAMLMVMGLGLMITLQAFVSMAVATGLGPVTGQPLPLFSRGGTGIIIASVYFGIMMAVSREQNELKAQSKAAEEESKREEIIVM
ncbi:MAG: FtsW/RodA/SpoVE family cell cycle protein [Paludibacteraceae bacterium]|nr:FtsW/RodA/SpoVE family cell cycle protein [Paludibacteraceae bacterium]